ncbi:MAG: acyl-CoA dehydrogenase family protein [Syntrophomonadaceae bacterium]|nr:acyl-CoA dehydrogenase family protein [Syntrophomonadaceae bacterium]
MFDFLMTPEQVALRDEAREMAKWVPRQYILDMDADRIKFPREFLQECGRRNLLGIRIPRQYGGRGLGWVDDIIVAEEICVPGYSFGCVWGVGADVVCDAICNFGSEELKEKYVKPLLRGEIFAAECLTEPRGGSDFFGATTSAVEKGDYYLISGQKRFIVGGEGADFFLVYAKTNPQAPPHQSMTCFLVDRDAGVKVKYLYGLMGCRGGGTARLVFDNVPVPKSNILGQVDRAAEIFYPMMVPERLGTAAMTIGAVRPAVEIATDYTARRTAFGTRIKNFQGVSFKVAEAVTKLDACRSLVYCTARAIDGGVNPNRARRLVSQTKKFVTDQCWETVNLCLQVMGGIGYTDIYPIEKILRDIRLSMIWVGSNEIMNMITQLEWYKEREQEKRSSSKRDCEFDSLNAYADEEKVYE